MATGEPTFAFRPACSIEQASNRGRRRASVRESCTPKEDDTPTPAKARSWSRSALQLRSTASENSFSSAIPTVPACNCSGYPAAKAGRQTHTAANANATSPVSPDSSCVCRSTSDIHQASSGGHRALQAWRLLRGTCLVYILACYHPSNTPSSYRPALQPCADGTEDGRASPSGPRRRCGHPTHRSRQGRRRADRGRRWRAGKA